MPVPLGADEICVSRFKKFYDLVVVIRVVVFVLKAIVISAESFLLAPRVRWLARPVQSREAAVNRFEL